jgi:hypothetical protein
MVPILAGDFVSKDCMVSSFETSSVEGQCEAAPTLLFCRRRAGLTKEEAQ